MMQILKIGKIRKCLLAKWSTFRNDNWINSWISWWVNAIYLTESLHYMGLSLSWLPGPDCHFLKSNLMVSTRAEICHSRAFKFPGKFPGKLEKSGKIPVSRESKNPGKSTPLHTTFWPKQKMWPLRCFLSHWKENLQKVAIKVKKGHVSNIPP